MEPRYLDQQTMTDVQSSDEHVTEADVQYIGSCHHAWSYPSRYVHRSAKGETRCVESMSKANGRSSGPTLER
jgi:hypothetical protein